MAGLIGDARHRRRRMREAAEEAPRPRPSPTRSSAAACRSAPPTTSSAAWWPPRRPMGVTLAGLEEGRIRRHSWPPAGAILADQGSHKGRPRRRDGRGRPGRRGRGWGHRARSGGGGVRVARARLQGLDRPASQPSRARRVRLLERGPARTFPGQLRAAAASEGGRLVFIEGEAGIGKTSLLGRFP